MDGNRQVVFDEMSGCGEVKVPLEGFQQEQLHVKQTLLGQDQVHGGHAAQAVQGLQLGHPVLSFLKFTCSVGEFFGKNITPCTQGPEHHRVRLRVRTHWPKEDTRARPCEAAAR